MTKDKMTVCKHCGAEIAAGAKTCPNCGGKNKKPIYKRVWFWILAVILVLGISGGSGGSSSDSTADTSQESQTVQSETTEASEEKSTNAPKDPTSDMTAEQKNAYKAAQNYVSIMPFSKQKLILQLSSDYGDGYPEDVAEFAVNTLEENGEVDWVEECKESAKNYLDMTSFSKEGLIEQLTSEYGEQFTQEEAEIAVEAVYQ